MRRDLDKPPPAGRAHRRALDATLAEWRKRGHLVGPEHALTRAVLRSLAEAADVVQVAEGAGLASSFSRARVVAELSAHLDRYAPPSVPARDPAAEQLTAAAQAVLDALDESHPLDDH